MLLVVSALSFGTLPVFGRVGYAHGLNVQSLLAARFLLAGVILGAFVLANRPAWPGWPAMAALALLGAVGYFGLSAAYFNSIRYIPAAVTSILLYTYPVIVTLLSRPLYGVPITRARVLALVTSLVGIYLVASPSGGLSVEGVALGLLSAVLYSGYILSGKRVLRDVDPWLGTAVIALSAGLAYLGVAAVSGTVRIPADPAAWLVVLGLALVSTVVGAGAFLAGLRLTDPGRASLISTLEPVATATFALLFLGELLGPGQLLGGVLVLVAVVLIARSTPTPQ